MREIKFMVWRKSTQEMCIPSDLEHLLEHYNDNEEYIARQYTGLKDKNEKEIYEGDIASFLHNYGEGSEYMNKYIDVVHYDTDTAGFVFGKEEFTFLEILEVEVIGNIYENPELREK